MTTYSQAPETVIQQANRIIEKYHSRLIDAGVKIQFVFALAGRDERGEIIGRAIPAGKDFQLQGYAKILSMKDRCLHGFDCEIVLDGDDWGNLDEAQQDALLDHELTHLALVTKGEKGAVQLDDCGRPKMRIKPHDVEIGWFYSVAQRHGTASSEMADLKQMRSDAPSLFQPELQLVKEVAA